MLAANEILVSSQAIVLPHRSIALSEVAGGSVDADALSQLKQNGLRALGAILTIFVIVMCFLKFPE